MLIPSVLSGTHASVIIIKMTFVCLGPRALKQIRIAYIIIPGIVIPSILLISLNKYFNSTRQPLSHARRPTHIIKRMLVLISWFQPLHFDSKYVVDCLVQVVHIRLRHTNPMLKLLSPYRSRIVLIKRTFCNKRWPCLLPKIHKPSLQ